MGDIIKVAYVHFAGKLPRKYPGKAIMSVSICTDYLGYHMVTNKVEAVDALTTNSKWIDIQALDFALDYLFRLQAELKESGVSRVFLVTDNSTIFDYLTTKPLNKTIRDWLEVIFQSYGVFCVKEINLGVGLCKLSNKNRAKTYYFERCVENADFLAKEAKSKSGVRRRIKKDYVFGNMDNFLTAKELLKDEQVEGLDGLPEM